MHDTGEHKCEYCPLVFNFKSQLIRHEKRVHDGCGSRENITPFYCAMCNRYFQTLKLLTENVLKHEKTDQSMRKYNLEFQRCIACYKIFLLNNNALSHHENISHPKLQLLCEVEGCQLTFKHKDAMIIHRSSCTLQMQCTG